MGKYFFIVKHPAINTFIREYIIEIESENVKYAFEKFINNLEKNSFSKLLIKYIRVQLDTGLVYPTLHTDKKNVWRTFFLSYHNLMDVEIVKSDFEKSNDKNKYTFFSSYKGKCFFIQVDGYNVTDAFLTWFNKSSKHFPKYKMDILKSSLGSSINITEIKVKKIWYFEYRIYKKCMLKLHIICTKKAQETSPIEWE